MPSLASGLAGIPCCLHTGHGTAPLFGLDLDGEYEAAVDTFALTEAEIKLMYEQARQAAFGPAR